MPLASGSGTSQTPGTDRGRAVVPDPGLFVPEWIAPNGVVLALNTDDGRGGARLFSTRAVSGLGLAPRELVTVDDPDGGEVVERTRVQARTLVWPIRMYGDTHQQFLALFRSTAEQFALTESMGAPGRLRITRAHDGTKREIHAYYQSGFEQDAEDAAWLRGGAVLNLRCPSPWWRDVNPTEVVFDERARPAYLNPYPTYGSGQILGDVEVSNLGQRAAWPTWTIRGPLTSLVATNVTRDETFTLTAALERGESVTITTKPIQVRGPAGEQFIGSVNLRTGGVLWRLDPRVPQVFSGVSRVAFTAAGSAGESTPGARDGTQIRLSFTQLYETA